MPASRSGRGGGTGATTCRATASCSRRARGVGRWCGGYRLPGYSVGCPPLAGWLGPRVVGALAVVAAAWLFERIAWARFGSDAWIGATWFALGAVSMLFSGRITFLL